MGFIQDFGPKRPPTANPPQAPPSAPASVSTPSDKPRPKQRGFFADFNPDAALAQEQRDSFVPRHSPMETSVEVADSQPAGRSWSSPPEEKPTESAVPSHHTGSTLTVLWDSPSPGRTEASSTTFGSSLEVASLTNEIKSLSERLQSVSPFGGSSDNRAGEIEQEISRTKYALSQAKEAVGYKRKRHERVEKMLERTKRVVSHMEMRMSGFDSGWGRGGGGGGRWRHRHNDEFLYTRDELRGPDNKEERQAQMGLVLDSRRDRIWKLQDELSNSRSAYMQAESKVKELEHKVDRLQGDLYQARQSKQNKQEQKSKLESKLADLKTRYRQLTGKSYGQIF